MTVRDYLTDPTLLALLRVWETEKRAPLPLVDRLLDLGLEGAAEGARWATEVKDRTVFGSEGMKADGLYPMVCSGSIRNSEPGYSWWISDTDRILFQFADNLPKEVYRNLANDSPVRGLGGKCYWTILDALVAFLDAFALSLQETAQ